MRFLIRYHVERAGGDTEYRDVDFEGEQITIGHGIDQIIKIPTTRIADEYAVIELQGRNKGRIKARTESGIVVNDKTVKSAALNLGDTITAGPSRLEVIRPPAGFDFALDSIRTGADPGDYAAHSRFSTKAQPTLLNRRFWSWLLFIIFIGAGFLLPFSGTLVKPLHAVLQKTPVVNDHLWASGPMQPPHSSLQCEQCHATPFIRVRNQQCLECHDDVTHHVDLQSLPVPELADARCASCHIEHNEPSGLVRNQQILCSDCHNDISEIAENTKLDNVSDFADDHPEFQLTMLTPGMASADTTWELVRSKVTPELKEHSNLNFPHDKHLDPEGVKSRSTESGKEVLTCTSCHQLDAGGEYILPISMEKDCRRCHELIFDRDDPDREVPHGDPELVKLTIEEYYSRKYLGEFLEQQNEQTSTAGSSLRRGRVGQATQAKIQASTEQAMQRLFVKDETLIKANCLQCHELEKTGSDDDYKASWRIIPVKLTRRWMPYANFNHYSHRLEDCDTCHQADKSTASTDILMPTLNTCQDCHSGGYDHGSEKIASTCVMCHSFHQPGKGKMAVLAE